MLKSHLTSGVIGLALSLLLFAPSAEADPCGMVPPIFVGNVSPISRIGLQKTYVFYKDGIETFVIRPGFQGNVDNFGMLIPFPNPPALRKVPDNIFEQIANAIDPPEVVVDLRAEIVEGFGFAEMAVPADRQMVFAADAADKVVVIKQEAVGMYEVAVLQAGSAKALKRWMDQNGFQYPDGMDTVTEDYVKQDWCFVAVKTRVGNKGAVNPAPGQRDVDSKLPTGSIFDGHVQGMGFRFKSEELVVPMRLSAFNGGDLRNIVYLLTDGPRKVRSIPEQFVVRQLKGTRLLANVTQPLPLRIIGGTEKDIPDYRRASLDEERNPGPHNAMAKELFASDLLSVATGDLSLKHEETEKELLRIGEHFGLRGQEIDELNAKALKNQRNQTVKKGLDLLAGMTLTVVDGDFPREVIAKENVTFEQYAMPASKNSTEFYQAPLFAPGGQKEGVLKTSFIDWPAIQQDIHREHTVSRFAAFSLLGLGLAIALAWCFLGKTGSTAVCVLAILLSLATTVSAKPANTSFNKPVEARTIYSISDITALIGKLKNSKTAAAGIEEIATAAKENDSNRQEAIDALMTVVGKGEEIAQKGWAIAALAKIGGQDVDEKLLDVQSSNNQPEIVKTWAAAARVSMTQSANGLIEKANLITNFPALGRPIGLRLIEKLNEDKDVNLAKILEITIKVPQLAPGLAPAIMAHGPAEIAAVAAHDNDNAIRRMATGYLGALANKGESPAVAEAVISQLQFQPDAKSVPWKGGALFLPAIQWSKPEAQQLVGQLIRWYLWCSARNDTKSEQQLFNNLRSIQLASAAGYQPVFGGSRDAQAWLETWGNVVGRNKIKAILKEQGLLDEQKYASVLEGLQNDN